MPAGVRTSPSAAALALVSTFAIACATEPNLCEEPADALYARRIEPILTDDRPHTCNQCHLRGVDLGLFVRATPCETMACMVELGIVDLDAPDESLVLAWIDRARPDGLITESAIRSEREAFRAWIARTSACDGLDECAGATCGPPPAAECELRLERFDGEPSMFDTSDCEPVTRERAFLEGVYAWRGRCSPCHDSTSTLGPADAPRWIAAGLECGPGALETMRRLVARGAIDFDDPPQSLLLRKPLAESEGGVMHGGHDKFANREDVAYRSFLAWIEYEASCRSRE